ncbi:serine-rich adhesin for platelets isoform X4 [Drosophila tropicalis]|uniref:serine-rich adhesin for platelets isoform X4 n=1 Tax=Drosophila tropicalis TaxID=46794 RepID=UPI0035AB755E
MELECDLGAIQSEELLRKMWQQSEDSERKKQIRSHLYKLRESRLRNLYRHDQSAADIMSEPNSNTLAGSYGKDPLATSHGDALLDQNFQSLKSKEVRDSMSPTHEIKFHSMSLTQPNTTGWDVQTSSEVSPDGRAYRTETLAKTDGVEKLNGGGIAEFKGRNEQRSSASHQGDDKNFVKKASESSSTQLQEKVVFGDDTSGRTEMKMSSTTSSSTSKVVSSSSSSTVEYGGGDDNSPRYLLNEQATPSRNQHQQQQQHQHHHQQQQQQQQYNQQLHQQQQQRDWEEHQRIQEQRIQEQLHQEHRQQEQLRKQEERYSESREQSNSTKNVSTQQHYEENKRYVDMDKASPEYQRHVQHLMAQPGEIISNTVEYPKPNVKMITTVKRLPDGTIVKNKRYETEQLSPTKESAVPRDHTRDMVDSAAPTARRRPSGNEVDEHVTQSQSFSSVKKSSRRFSTETTSETIQETHDDREHEQPRQQIKAPSPGRQDFSTQGFPSVRPNKPTQEFQGQRPSTPQSPRQQPTTNSFSTHGFPSVKPNIATQEYPSQRPSSALSGEEVIVVKSEKSRNVKQHTSSERTIETEYAGDEQPEAPSSIRSKPQAQLRASTPSWEQPPSPRRTDVREDFSTHGFPSVRSDQTDGEVIHHVTKTVSRNHSATHKTNAERVIETEVEEPEQQQRRRPQQLNAPNKAQYTGPRSPTRRSPTRKPSGQASPSAPGQTNRSGRPGSESTTTTTSSTVTRRQLQKEREVDAAHRAFAASLRSSSPAESNISVGSHSTHTRRDSGRDSAEPQRLTPRSSISSSRTYRRDTREGSHDSHAPSESSRISSTTVTRHAAPTNHATTTSTTKSVGKNVVTKQQQQHHTVVKSRNVQGSNETIDLTPQRLQKSPSPTSGTTKITTTKTTTTTQVTAPSPAPASAPTKPSEAPLASPSVGSNEPSKVPDNNLSQYTYTTTKPGDIFSLPPTSPTSTINNNNNNNNEPTITTTTTTTIPKRTNNNKNTPLTTSKNSQNSDTTETIIKTKLSTNEATSTAAPVEEPPCVKLHYYKVGPSVKEVPDPVPVTNATAVTSSETVAKPKERTGSRPSIDDDGPVRRSSKSKSPSIERRPVQRETTFESPKKRPEDVSFVNEQETVIRVTTTNSEVRDKSSSPLPRPRSRPGSPEKQPTQELPRSVSPEKTKPASQNIDRAQSPAGYSSPVPRRSKDFSGPNTPEKPHSRQQVPAYVETVELPTQTKQKTSEKVQPDRDSPIRGPTDRKSKSPEKILTEKPKTQSPRVSSERVIQISDNRKQTETEEDTLFRSTINETIKTTTKNLNEEFITNERQSQPQPQSQPIETPKSNLEDGPESPDGGFYSKSPNPEPNEPSKPTYRKKGLTRRETFEDRCRKILGMEEDGDTQGNYTTKPNNDESDDDDDHEEKTSEVVQQTETETMQVKIEDCLDDDDDEDRARRVTETFVVRTQPIIKVEDEQPQLSEVTVDLVSEPEEFMEPSQRTTDNTEELTINEETTIVINKRPSKSPSVERKAPTPSPSSVQPNSAPRSPSPGTSFVAKKVINCTDKTVVEKTGKSLPDKKQPSDVRSTNVATIPLESKPSTMKKQPYDDEPNQSEPKKKTPTERRNSRNTSTTSTSTTTTSTKTTSAKQTALKEPQPTTTPSKGPSGRSPRKESLPRRETAKRDSVVEETRTNTKTKPSVTKPNESSPLPSSIKDRLRSSPRKQRPQTSDNVDGESSSPDGSPTRPAITERRRSSNISVHTEIIIDHTAPKTPSPRVERKSVSKVNPARKPFPVVERKESAPVPRVTKRDKDKVTRSTSENVIKVVNGKPSKPTVEMSTLRPHTNRTTKCFTTKTINLSEQISNNELDMENVIIDIQQAKSSREPSPDRIVPTPVPAELDTGKPRYPDVVQEPEDEPRKKPVVTNIPIFEEEANSYVGYQISELRTSNGIEDDILDNPTVEAPQSLDYPTSSSRNTIVNDIVEDECLLSVHEKVSKFTHTAEQVKQPKSSTPFTRQFDEHTKVSASDECLLSINQKVDKFLKTAENITKQPITPTRDIERPNYEDLDEELRQDDCTLSVSQKVYKFIDTAEKLAPTVPQKSPGLVANIERHISRQSEPELEDESEPENPMDSDTDVEKKSPLDDEELTPMSKNHTTALELKRQKDILNRPSVFGKTQPPASKPHRNPTTAFINEERKSQSVNQRTTTTTRQTTSPSKSPSRSTRPSLAQTRPKQPTQVSATDSGRDIKSPTKQMEHISQQQWVHNDVDIEVEEVGPAPGAYKRPTKPQAKSPSLSPSPSPSPTRSRPSSSLSATKTNSTVVKNTSSTTEHHNTSTTMHTPTNQQQQQPQARPSLSPSPSSSSPVDHKIDSLPGQVKPTRSSTVASRRNVFEKASSPSPTPTATTPSTEPNGRRPSYMDHTKSSLEHIRRDSLEINKTHYSRKSSIEDEANGEPRNPNTSVKFDVPSKRQSTKTSSGISEEVKQIDLEIEEIFDLQILEQLLETVTSYELRRRIRAQMRLIRKNMINAGTTTTTTTTTTKTSSLTSSPSAGRSPLPSRREPQPRDRSHSPEGKATLKMRTNSNRLQSRTSEQVDSTSLQGKPPVKPRERSASPAQSRPATDTITTTTTTRTTTKSRNGPSSSSPAPERRSSKPSSSGPIWADRSKVLRGHTNPVATQSPTSVRKSSTSSTTSSSSKITRTQMATSSSSTTSSSTTKKNNNREEDSITSSYGVGPTDENGLPVFGLRALKKKTQPVPCETKEEVTGYVIEEKFYSDSKSPPRHERKELHYSTNADELSKLQTQLERKSSNDSSSHAIITREFEKIEPPSDTKYVRRGSVKELSEKFIQKESTTSHNEMPDTETEDSESNDVCSVIEVETPAQLRHKERSSSTFSSNSTSTRSQNTRSFLNTKGEERLVTGVNDVLDRMRNADNVIEPGDSNEDREARALLNKFLGASVLMQGVESMLPPGTTSSSSTISTTNTAGQRQNSQAVKTTRITNTYSKSGSSSSTTNSNSNNSNNNKNSSSSPVLRTTCDIEDIWDEEVLKQLLEQASNYEERRKIRARLRELMAEREDKKAGNIASAKKQEEADESSASEYEEIIEEVTDYSDDDDVDEEEPKAKEVKDSKKDEKDVKEKQPELAKTIESKTNTTQTKSVQKVEQKLAKVELESKQETVVDGHTQVQKVNQGESLSATATTTAATATETETSAATTEATITATTTTTTGDADIAKPSSSLSSRKFSSQVSQKLRTRDKAKADTMPTGEALSTGTGSTGTPQVTRLSVPQKEDSGTESGEDLRLLAAGLRDTLQQRSSGDASEANRSLVEEVTDALSRLECSLKQGKELAVDGGQRQALLALVARLQTGLSAPEKLPSDVENSLATHQQQQDVDQSPPSPEPDQSGSRQQRFAKRRQRNSRYTVGVSREELADARRYMEDMIMFDNKKSFVPLEKNASSSAIQPGIQLYRPNQFVSNQQGSAAPPPTTTQQGTHLKPSTAGNNRRPLSGDYAVSFASYANDQSHQNQVEETTNARDGANNRFNGARKQLMKRANTIDIPKAKAKYMADCDSDSDAELDEGPHLGLKRTVQVSVKRRVHNAVPPFEPKTENDHKFLAFINKQSHQSGLGWGGGGSSRSVSNWTHKFGNIKHTFETGAAAQATKGKPPQAPSHVPGWAKQEHQQQQREQMQREQMQREKLQREHAQRKQLQREHYQKEQLHREQLQREQLQREQLHREQLQREKLQHEQLQREQLHREQLQREQIQREQLQRDQHQRELEQSAAAQAQAQALAERQRRQELERQLCLEQEARFEREQRARLEREYYEKQLEIQHLERQQQLERQRKHQEQMELQRRQEMELRLQQQKAAPLNHFIHAPQSVFRPIEHDQVPAPSIFKPIAQKHGTQPATWQPPSTQTKTSKHLQAPGRLHSYNSNTPSPSSTATSPIGLPWVAKPKVDNSDFRRKAHHFEERSLRDNLEQQQQQQNVHHASNTYLQRHNSLRSKSPPPTVYTEFRKRPSLPNAMDPSGASYPATTKVAAPPPQPTNISFTYADFPPVRRHQGQFNNNYRSQPCLPSAVADQADPLTNPLAAPLVLTTSNPTYLPPTSTHHTAYDTLAYHPHNNNVIDVDSSPTSPTSFLTVPAMTDNTDDDLDMDSDNNMLEYRVETKVMRKPKSQTAVRVADRRTAHMSDDEVFGRNSRAAKSLLYTMKNLSGAPESERPPPISAPQTSSVLNRSRIEAKPQSMTAPNSPKPAGCLSPDGRQYQAPLVEPLFPKLTNYEANRQPHYASIPSIPVSINYQANPTYTPPTPPVQQPPRPATDNGYLGETHTSYVVTYPLDDSADELESSISQRLRRTSERSNASSSLSLPSASTSWTANPVHKQPASVTVPPLVDRSNKPQLAPKPEIPIQQAPSGRPRLSIRSHTIGETTTTTSSSSSTTPMRPQAPMLRQSAIIDSAPAPAPVPLKNRVMSQQSLQSTSALQNHHQQQQQRKDQQHLSELRRKSLGNVLEHRGLTYYEHQQMQEYKSSAPADTPDIVKSSLPKENAPLLKKFGPPQRHHYVPNAYQSPQLKNSSSSQVTTTTTTIQHEVIHQQQQQQQHQQQKPSIVETPATPQPQPADLPPEEQIPRNIVFNNVSAFSSMSRRSQDEEQQQQQQQGGGGAGSRINRLSKCDSWTQICQQQQQQSNVNPTKYNQAPPGGELRRSKSGHTLAVPKLYEAGIDKSQLNEKQRTVAAYFSGQKSPTGAGGAVVDEIRTLTASTSSRKSAINRTKTSEKLSTARKSLSTLSSTSNAQQKQQTQSSTTSERTATKSKDGGSTVTTTTTKVTTRTVSGSAAASSKNISPLAKFKQLDKQAAAQQAQKTSK